MPVFKLLTSNVAKLREFQRLASHLDIVIEKGADLKEVKSDAITTAFHKSKDASSFTIIEDTILEIDGMEVVDIRYRLNELGTDNPSVALWKTTLAVNDGHAIKLYIGEVKGVFKQVDISPEDSFGFDAYSVPRDQEKTLYELHSLNLKDNFSARALAVNAFCNSEHSHSTTINELSTWTGEYQS